MIQCWSHWYGFKVTKITGGEKHPSVENRFCHPVKIGLNIFHSTASFMERIMKSGHNFDFGSNFEKMF